MPDIRQPLPSGVVLQKDFLVLYAVALAAVPVLVPYGKAGVKGCDFVVIIHVHILLCVHVEFFTLKIMHSILRNRILHPAGTSWHSWLCNTPQVGVLCHLPHQSVNLLGGSWAKDWQTAYQNGS